MPHAPGEFPFEIEAAVLAKIDDADPALATLLDHEPREFAGPTELPAAVLFWIRSDDEDHQTGPATQVTWHWRLNLYCALEQGWESAQRELRARVPRVLKSVRADPSLGGECERCSIVDPGGEPEFNTDEMLVWKSLHFQAITEETS